MASLHRAFKSLFIVARVITWAFIAALFQALMSSLPIYFPFTLFMKSGLVFPQGSRPSIAPLVR
jgi:hypothetical protein